MRSAPLTSSALMTNLARQLRLAGFLSFFLAYVVAECGKLRSGQVWLKWF